MNWIKEANKLQKATVIAIVLLQIAMLLSMLPMFIAQINSKTLMLAEIVVVELCFLFMLFTVVKSRFFVATISIYLLFALNFFTPILTKNLIDSKLITLPKNLKSEIQIVGDVMPGFSGLSRVSTDNKGFRVSKPIDYDHKKGFRIFAIGGSTTEQIFIDDTKTWTALLEKRLETSLGKEVEVINTGASGLRAEQHFYTFKNILQYSPDLVLFLVGINDWNKHIKEHLIEDQTQAYKVEHTLSFIDFRQSLIFVGSKVLRDYFKPSVDITLSPTQRIEDGSYYSSQNDSLSRSIIKRFQPNSVSNDYQIWLHKIVDLCRKRKVECMFINQPIAYQNDITKPLLKRLWMTPPNENYTLPLEDMRAIANLYNNWLINFSLKNTMNSCDLAIKVPPTTAFFYDDCHYNEGGAKKVASLISQCVLDIKNTKNQTIDY